MIDLSNYNFLSAAINLAAVFFCSYWLTRRSLRFSPVTVAIDCIVYSIASVLALPLVREYTFLTDNRGLLPMFGLYFPIFYLSLSMSLPRTLCIYIWAVVLFIFPSNIACLIDAGLHPEHSTMAFDFDTFFMHAIFSIGLCIYIFWILSKWDTRLFSSPNIPDSIWYGWLSIPILFLGLNIALLPENYDLLQIHSLEPTYLFFSSSLFILYMYLTSIFYSYMTEYLRIQEFKEEQRISDIQKLQYANLQAQMEADRHARHDFKHTLHLLSQLASAGDMDGLISYIREYAKESSSSIFKKYCPNPAINALINYYENLAEQEGVLTKLQVDLSDPLPMSDPEFCALTGNIMENAINAASEAPPPNRRFSLSMCIQNDSTLYIVSSNDYNSKLTQESTPKVSFFSTKNEKLHGIGLQSIRETVDKYHGTLRISKTDSEYFLDIAIKL